MDAIQYILMQPQEVIDIYIDTFIMDCLRAYSTGRGESCIKGQYERIFMSYRDTMSTVCLDQIQGTGAAPLCKPEYIKIFDKDLIYPFLYHELDELFKLEEEKNVVLPVGSVLIKIQNIIYE